MGGNKVIGIVLLVIGLILLYFGWQSSQSVSDQLTETFTGRFTDSTMWFLIIGAAAAVGGILIAVVKK